MTYVYQYDTCVHLLFFLSNSRLGESMIPLDRSNCVRIFVGLLSVVFISACDVETPTNSAAVQPTVEIAPDVHAEVMKDAPDEARIYGPLDAYYLSLAREHPGFGGLYFANGEMVIQTKSGQVPKGLRRIGHPAVAKRASPVAFSFEDLARWYGPFVDAVATTEWYQADIDERANRLEGVVADVGATRRALQQAGVPSAVYTLRVGSPMRPAKTLRDKFRPIPTGVQIDIFSMTEGHRCTAGFNLSHWEFGPAMVTASHCTSLTAELDVGGARVHQAVAGNRVGTEVFDHEAFAHPDCPEDYCRYSDAAVISYADSVSYQLGKVAKPITNSGSIEVAGLRFTIVDSDITGPADGTPLFHVGRTTGWNTGEVEATCANVNWYSHQNYGLLCQYESGWGGIEGGDSGGPVLIPSPSSDSVTLAGIQHSHQTDATLDKDTWFSPMGGIRWEIKPNTDLECDGLLTTHDGGCGDSGGSGSWDGGGGDDCGQFAIQEC